MSPLSEEQARKLKEYNRKRGKEYLATIGGKLETEYLKSHLRFWSVVLGLVGALGIGMNAYFLAMGQMRTAACLFMIWGAGLIVLAVFDWFVCTYRMLRATGIVMLIHSMAVLLFGSLWGILICIAAIVAISDSQKARKKEKEAAGHGPPPIPPDPEQ